MSLFHFSTTLSLFVSENNREAALIRKLQGEHPRLQVLNYEHAFKVLSKKTLPVIDVLDEDEEFNAEEVLSILYNPERFSETAVVIVIDDGTDNSLKLLNELKHVVVKKILLGTRERWGQIVDEFNEQLFDYFVVNDDVTVLDNLKECIKRANEQYFFNISQTMLSSHNQPVIHSAVYQQLKSQFLSNFNLTEFYQLDELGSGVGLTSMGEVYWLAISNDEQKNHYLHAASFYDIKHEIMQKLTSSTHLLFLPLEQEKKLAPEYWEEYLFEVEGDFKIGSQNFSYSVLTNKSFSLQAERIVNYADNLECCIN